MAPFDISDVCGMNLRQSIFQTLHESRAITDTVQHVIVLTLTSVFFLDAVH